MAIDAKEAVKAAMAYVADIYSSDKISDVLLEEIDRSKGGGSWLVTVSFYRPSTPYAIGTLGQIVGGNVSKRQYKVINVDRETAEIHSMTMRAKVTPDDGERS